MDAQNVSFGKPNAAGAVYVAPAGTAVPTDGTTALAAAFSNLGYVHEDGLVNGTETDTESVMAWGGQKVLEEQTNFSENFTFSLIETNVDTLKLYYGDDKVTEADGAITIQASAAPLEEKVVVFEIAMTGGRVKRIVVPRAKIADRSGEITYVDGEPIAYPINLVALPDDTQTTHTEYIAVVA
jgi:hypothetical protein